MAEQNILTAQQDHRQLDAFFQARGVKCVLLVCGKSMTRLRLWNYFERLEPRLGIHVVVFREFQPNPRYESVAAGVEAFRAGGCDCIAAVGGGSAMDVAKCIKLYANMDPAVSYLSQEIVPNEIPLLAVPTTAGTGSEATRFAVIYAGGEKQSVSHESCIPTAVLMDASVLESLPEYQRKVTMLDAFCHAIESFWSVNSTPESQAYSRQAIGQILAHWDGYLRNAPEGNAGMLAAANLAGKAINITQTTAGHAMCYKLTGLYGLAHGHAAALCVRALWPYMAENLHRCVDPRGEAYLKKTFQEMAQAMGCETVEAAIQNYQARLDGLGLAVPTPSEAELEVLKHSVNPVRLKNNPVALDVETMERLYRQMLCRPAKGETQL